MSGSSSSAPSAVPIGRDSVVTLQYAIHDRASGALLERSQAPITYLHGGYGGIFEKVEEALTGREAGAEIALDLEPGDAFGEFDAGLRREEARRQFPKNVKVGMQFQGTPDAGGRARVYTVQAVTDEHVVVDANHPWAGKAVRIECKVESVRAATREEISHGHVHGPGGHHH
jgi:FKBP-type peptidyl-prolyl cis-trans isomerase SlyD